MDNEKQIAKTFEVDQLFLIEREVVIVTDTILIAKYIPSTYKPFTGADGLAVQSTQKLLATWQELKAHGSKTKSGFPVDLASIEEAIYKRVYERLASMGFILVA